MLNTLNKLLCIFFFVLAPFLAGAQTDFLVIFLHKNIEAPKISKEESSRLMKSHMNSIEKLWKEKKLLASGPFEGGGGLFILNTTSIETAKSWVAQDSGILAKRWSVEMLPYKPRYGGVCAVTEPYEMTQYTFVRFDVVVTKSSATNYPEILKRHDDYIAELKKNGSVVTEAIFSERDGGIVIIRGDLQTAVIEQDPGVQEGLIQFDIKKLHIAKGSFCE